MCIEVLSLFGYLEYEGEGVLRGTYRCVYVCVCVLRMFTCW